MTDNPDPRAKRRDLVIHIMKAAFLVARICVFAWDQNGVSSP
jgi:hypothetical protein